MTLDISMTPVALYLAVSLLISVAAARIASGKEEAAERYRLGFFFFLMSIALPLLGLLVIPVILLARAYTRVPDPLPPFREIHLDEYYDHPPTVRRLFGEGAIREIIHNDQVSISLRLTALTLLSEHNSRLNYSLIKQMLSSRNDELRLLSFSIVDKTEHRINHQIHETLDLLKNIGEDDPRKAKLFFQLAQLYWELVYFQLVDEVLTDFLLTEVQRYAQATLEQGESPLRVHILLGRVAFERNDYETAQRHFDTALRLGREENRERETAFLTPYLAEIAYRHGNFKEVRQLMGEAWHFALNPTLKPIQELWSR